MAIPGNEVQRRISKVSQSFQKTLNNRLDKMTFEDQTAAEYDDPNVSHQDNHVYFVQRDANTIELWKGDIQISGQGGGSDWTVVNSLLLESASVSAVTGGANGSRFMAVNTGDTFDIMDTPSYGQHSGDFKLTTRGKPSSGGGSTGAWITMNHPFATTDHFQILYNYQPCMCVSSPSVASKTTAGPKYVIELLRNGVRETITIRPFIFAHHVSVPTYQRGSVAAYKYSDTYEDALYQAVVMTGNYITPNTGYYVTRAIEGGATSHGYYYAGGGSINSSIYNTRNAYNTAVPSIAISGMYYDSQQDAVLGILYYLTEYPRSQNRFGQLGILYDLDTGAQLATPQAIFNANHPQNYDNEYIMYKILRGESIT